jgi:N-acetyl-gamma-glutamyl-phosphate reductase
MRARLKTAVLGATGYAGFELAQLLAHHPRVEAPLLLRREGNGEGPSDLAEVFPQARGNGGYPLVPFSWELLKQRGVDLLYLATPHELSRKLAPEAISQDLRVIDLSGAWRLKRAEHREAYKFAEVADGITTALDQAAVYGLPELNRIEIGIAPLVANPGCYATSVILALAPLVKSDLVDLQCGVVADCKSGVSGAGKEPTSRTHFVSVADNLSAYAVFGHRHTGEILEQLGLQSQELIFTPHLLPIPRGILSTLYLRLKRTMTPGEVEQCYRSFYQGCHWVRVFPAPNLPQIQFSLRTNYCDIGLCLADDGRRLVIVSCVDNLLKGAAGQAVQNMNLMFGWNEAEGLN